MSLPRPSCPTAPMPACPLSGRAARACPCEAHRRARADYQQWWYTTKGEPRTGHAAREKRHGAIHTYNHGCRCEPCRAAKRRDAAARRDRARMADPTFPHGQVKGYRLGCRCATCLPAGQQWNRERHAAVATAAARRALREAQREQKRTQAVIARTERTRAHAAAREIVRKAPARPQDRRTATRPTSWWVEVGDSPAGFRAAIAARFTTMEVGR